MLIVAAGPTIVMLVGGVVYLLPLSNPKITEMGKLAFFAGILVLLFNLAGTHVRLVSP